MSLRSQCLGKFATATVVIIAAMAAKGFAASGSIAIANTAITMANIAMGVVWSSLVATGIEYVKRRLGVSRTVTATVTTATATPTMAQNVPDAYQL